MVRKIVALAFFSAAALLLRGEIIEQDEISAALQPIAFFDFSAGTVGEAADEITDASGKYVGQASMTSANGVVPYYTNNAPNRIAADFTCTSFYTSPKALAFEYGPDPGDAITPPGGQVNFPNLAARLIGRAQAYTIEYFVRLDESFNYGANGYKYNSKTSLYVGGDDYGYKVITPATVSGGTVDRLKMQLDGNIATKPDAGRKDIFNNGRWHHLAFVYQPGEGGATLGKLTFYVDYNPVETFDFDNKTPQNTPVFRLGTGRDSKLKTEPFHGWITCLRVSERVLAKEEMMVIVPDLSQKDAIFWDFKEGQVGENANWLYNTGYPTFFWARAYETWDGNKSKGAVPAFNEDRPGMYIYSDSQMTNVLSCRPQSLRFAPGTSEAGGGKVEINNLASSLSTLDAYTVEMFFRSEGTGDYRTPISWRLSPTYGFTFKLRNSGPSTDLVSGHLEELTKTTGLTMQTLSVVNYKNADVVTTNSWHHLAVVCDAVSRKAALYLDYHKAGEASYSKSAWGGHPLTLGTSSFFAKAITEAFGGYLSCLRVTPRALPTDGFMVTRDHNVSPTVFAWSFEEGTQKIGETLIQASGYPNHTFDSADNSKVYCLHKDCYPQYAASLRKGRMVTWGENEMWTNRTCAYFQGYEKVKGQANDRYAGTEMNFPASVRPDCNPAEWTMEAFVRAESFFNTATLFGKHAQATPHQKPAVWPQFCWVLTMDGIGGLGVHWEEAGRESYSEETYGRTTGIAPRILEDKAWHHVALSYKKTERMFRLYVDYNKVWEKTLAADLLDAPGGYYFSRIESFAGFQGWMDEIRFSNVALEPEDFVKFPPLGLRLIVR